MRLAVNLCTVGPVRGAFMAVGRVIRDLAPGLGVAVTRPCRSSEKVQVRQECAGGAGRILHALWVLAGIVLLAACAGRVEPQIQYVRVEVPVQVPCRAPEVAVPLWAAAGLRKTDSLEVKVRALLAERRQRIGYERLLEAAVNACR